MRLFHANRSEGFSQIFRALLLTISLSLSLAFSLAFSPSSAAQSLTCVDQQLELEIQNIQSAGGDLFVAVHQSASTFLEKEEVPYKSSITPVDSGGAMLIRFCDLTDGFYAVSIFHDQNSNGELDTGFLGFPKEPFGFSKNLPKLRPPSFKAAVFEHNGRSSLKIELK